MGFKLLCRRPCPDITFKRQMTHINVDRFEVRMEAVVEGVPRVMHHSPTGLEWGYGGSGPADTALSILAFCLPIGCDGQEAVPLFRGQCSAVAWRLHQSLKWGLIARLDRDGDELPGYVVDHWIDAMLTDPTLSGLGEVEHAEG